MQLFIKIRNHISHLAIFMFIALVLSTFTATVSVKTANATCSTCFQGGNSHENNTISQDSLSGQAGNAAAGGNIFGQMSFQEILALFQQIKGIIEQLLGGGGGGGGDSGGGGGSQGDIFGGTGNGELVCDPREDENCGGTEANDPPSGDAGIESLRGEATVVDDSAFVDGLRTDPALQQVSHLQTEAQCLATCGGKTGTRAPCYNSCYSSAYPVNHQANAQAEFNSLQGIETSDDLTVLDFNSRPLDLLVNGQNTEVINSTLGDVYGSDSVETFKITNSSAQNMFFYGGNDVVEFFDSTADQVDTGSGDDLLELNGSSRIDFVQLGAGHDKLVQRDNSIVIEAVASNFGSELNDDVLFQNFTNDRILPFGDLRDAGLNNNGYFGFSAVELDNSVVEMTSTSILTELRTIFLRNSSELSLEADFISQSTAIIALDDTDHIFALNGGATLAAGTVTLADGNDIFEYNDGYFTQVDLSGGDDRLVILNADNLTDAGFYTENPVTGAEALSEVDGGEGRDLIIFQDLFGEGALNDLKTIRTEILAQNLVILDDFEFISTRDLKCILIDDTSTISSSGICDFIDDDNSGADNNGGGGTDTGNENDGGTGFEDETDDGNDATTGSAGNVDFGDPDDTPEECEPNEVFLNGVCTEALTGDEGLGTEGDDELLVQNNAGDINTLAGADNILISRDAIVDGDIDTGSGDDNLTIDDQAKVNGDILLGVGDDNLDIKDEAVVDGEIDADTGDDEILIADTAQVTDDIQLGNGDDRITFSQNGIADGEIDGGAGEDTIAFILDRNQTRTLGNNLINIEDLDVTGQGAVALDRSYSFEDIALNDRGSLIINDGNTLTVTNQITGDSTSNELQVKGTLTGDANLGAGNDNVFIDLNTGATVNGTIDGGSGVDSYNFISSEDTAISSNGLTNFETIGVSGGAKFDLSGTDNGITGLTISDNGTELVIQSGNSYQTSVNGDDNSNTLTIDGILSGNVDLGGGADTLNINLATGSFNGTARGGDGLTDSVNLSDTAQSTNISLTDYREFETINLAGSTTYVTSGTNDTDLNTINLNDTSNLIISNGANVNTDISGSDDANEAVVLGGLNGAVNLNGGDDNLVYDLDSSGGINATLNGGSGTDNFQLNSSTTRAVSADVSSFEKLTLLGGGEITLQNNYGFDNVELDEGSDLSIGSNRTLTITNELLGDDLVNNINLNSGAVINASSVNLAGGNDIIRLSSNSQLNASSIDGGSGEDKVIYDQNTTQDINGANFVNVEILELDGAGDYTLKDSGSTFDFIGVINDSKLTFDTGTSNNLAVFGDNSGVEIDILGTNLGKIDTGSGNDIIGITDSYSADIDTNAGDDIINSDNATVRGTIDLGSGINSISGNITNSGEIITDTNLIVNGDYAQSSFGEYSVNVGSDNIATNRIISTGSSVLSGVINTSGINQSGLVAGDKITLVTAANGITDNGVTISSPTIANDLYGWNQAVNGTNLDLEYLYARLDCSNMADLTGDAKAVCMAISDSTADSRYSEEEIQNLLMVVNNAQSDDQADYLSGMNATGYISSNQAISRAVTAFHGIAHDRIFASDMADRLSSSYANVQNGGRNKIYEDFACGGYGGFVNGASSAGEGSHAYSSNSNGVFIAGDCVNDEAKVGVNIAYQTSSLDDDKNYSAATDMISVGAYASMKTTDGVILGASANIHSAGTDAVRTVMADSASAVNTGDFSTLVFSAKAEAGYDVKAGKLLLRPFGGLEYQVLESDEVIETGSGITHLGVDAYSSSRALLNIGGRAVYDKIWADKMIMASPYAEVELVTDIIGMEDAVDTRILDSVFSSSEASTSATRFKLGAGVDGTIFNDSGLNQHSIFGHLKYEAGIDESSSDSSLRLGYKYNF